MKHTIRKRLAALLCAASLLATQLPLTLAADETAEPSLSVTSTTVTKGNSCTVTLSGSDFAAVTALTVLVTYDTALTLTSAVATTLSDWYTSVNTQTDGLVNLSAISLKGLSGDNNLLTLTFQTGDDTPAGDYKISLAVEEAVADLGGVDTDLVMTTVPGTITVKEPVTTTPEVYFSMSRSASSVEAGSDVTFTIQSYNLQSMAAGQFSFTYDSDMFVYKELKLLSPMSGEGAVYSINSTNAGQVVLAYANDEAVPTGELMSLTLTALENAAGSTAVGFNPASLYDAEGNVLAYNTLTSMVTITEKPEEVVIPSVWMSAPEVLTTDKSFEINVYVEGESALAAGDFIVAYDTEALICEGVTSPQGSDDGESTSAVLVSINDTYNAGTVKFSLLCDGGIAEDVHMVTLAMRAKNNADTTTTLNSSVNLPVDNNIQTVDLDCKPLQVSIAVPSFEVTFKDWDGTVLDTQSVLYLSPAAAPGDPVRTDYTESVHYVFSDWDVDFASITGDTTVTAVYSGVDHVMGDWSKQDDERHACSCACGYIKYSAHDWGKWTCSEEGHARVCSDCPAVQVEPHDWKHGYCSECDTQGVVLVWENGVLQITAEGLNGYTNLFIAWYDANEKMLGCLQDQADENGMFSASDISTGDAVKIKVFFTDGAWYTVRSDITVP